ncbi:MAG: PEP-CTERM sorting domain-containing protein [Planctomycetia bacterium]|nr:PEP-CTERM sorting domain-containing protein [Planctomycetia bacterium]
MWGGVNIHSSSAQNEQGKIGSLLELKSGTIDAPYLSIGQGGAGDGVATFNMTGGNLVIYQTFHAGDWRNGTANIYGGVLEVNELAIAREGWYNGTLNINGSKAIINTNTLTAATNGNLNFIAGEFNADGNMFSTITVRNTANILGAFSVSMSNSAYNGVTYLTGDLTQTLISATNTLTYTPKSEICTLLDGWTLELNESDNKLVLTFDESQFAFADVTSGSGFALGNLGTEGWVTLNGKKDATVDLSMAYSGVEDVEDFVMWLQESIGNDVTVRGSEDVITFENLVLDGEGKGYLNFGLSAYTDGNVSFVDGSNHVPEPASWALLILGATALVFTRRKR